MPRILVGTGLDDCVKIACGANGTDINPSVQYLLVELWEVVAVNMASVSLAAAGSASDVGAWKEDLRWIVRLLEETLPRVPECCVVYHSDVIQNHVCAAMAKFNTRRAVQLEDWSPAGFKCRVRLWCSTGGAKQPGLLQV